MDNDFLKSLEILKSNGLIVHSSIEQKTINGITGIYATEDISANTIITQIPHDLCITDNKNFSIVFNNKEINTKYSKYIHCVAYLLYEKNNKNSIYKSYFKLLPKLDDLKKGVIDLNSEIYKDLKRVSTSIHTYIENGDKLLISNSNLINNFLKEYNLIYNKEEIEWGILFYTKYAWANCFCPILDLFNHSNTAHTQDLTPIKDRIIKTYKDIKKGEQIYDSYGAKDLVRIALNYGFFDNSDDIYFIRLPQILFTAKNELNFFKAGLLINRIGAKITKHTDKGISVEISDIFISSDYFNKNIHENSKQANTKLNKFIEILVEVNLPYVLNIQSSDIRSNNFNSRLMELLLILKNNFHSDILKSSNEYSNEHQHIINAIIKKQNIIDKLIEDCKKLL